MTTDAETGRLYLPLEDLEAHGYPVDGFVNRVEGDALARLIRFEADRAARFYRDSLSLLPMLSRPGRRCRQHHIR